MFDHLLVPLDGSRRATWALRTADRLAEQWDADITVFTVRNKENRDLDLDDLVARQVSGVGEARRIEIRPASYSVAEDIAAASEEEVDTLVVMSTMARGRVAGVAANVAEDVLRHIREPMLLVGPVVELPDDWPSGRLMVCVDGSDFAETIVPLAARWSESLALDPMILAVVDPSKVPAGVPQVYESNTVARTADTMRELVDRPVNYDTLHGSDPAISIAGYARDNGAGMLALATHARAGIDRVLHDSVAMGVIRSASCPVLISRPRVDPGR